MKLMSYAQIEVIIKWRRYWSREMFKSLKYLKNIISWWKNILNVQANIKKLLET